MNALCALVLATVLPESILGARWFAVLSAFVAINTILYVSMSIFKILPKPYLSDVLRRHGRRAETRSIYPDGYHVHDTNQAASGDRGSRGDAQTTVDRELTGSLATGCRPTRDAL